MNKDSRNDVIKHIGFLLLLVIFALAVKPVATFATSDTTIVEFNFEDAAKQALITDNTSFENNPYTADDGIAENMNVSKLSLSGGASFKGWINGSGGSGTKAPMQITGV